MVVRYQTPSCHGDKLWPNRPSLRLPRKVRVRPSSRRPPSWIGRPSRYPALCLSCDMMGVDQAARQLTGPWVCPTPCPFCEFRQWLWTCAHLSKFSPYALAGGGGLIFHSTGTAAICAGPRTLNKKRILYGAGGDYVLTATFRCALNTGVSYTRIRTSPSELEVARHTCKME